MVDVLISEVEIRVAVARLAVALGREYHDKPLTVLGVMTGGLMFLADLVRLLDRPLQVGVVQASSYRQSATTPGELRINDGFMPEIAGRDVLLLDDIFDTGQTLVAMLERLSHLQPASLKSAVLLWKEGRQTVSATPDFHCFKIPDRFVVGYGLDYNNEYRHLPYVGVLSGM